MYRIGAVVVMIGCCGAVSAQMGAEEKITLTVKPATTPTPSLRYKLLPEMRDLTPGNAAQLYYRSYSPEWQIHRKPEQQKLIADWSEDTTKMPPGEMKWVTTSKMLEEVDRAARREYCNFELLPRLREDGVGTLLPDLQGFREIARLLAMRARFENAAGEHDKAIETFKTGFALARHISEGGTLIHALVAIAITQSMCFQIEQCMMSPGAPNLYHALTYLPHPFIDMRKSYEGERLLFDSLFPGIRDSLTPGRLKAMRESDLEAMQERLTGLAKSLQIDPKERGLDQFLKAIDDVAAEGRKTLVKLGHKEDLVKKLPAFQAALMLEVYNSDRLYDDTIRMTQLSYPEAAKALKELEKEMKTPQPGHTFVALLLPAMSKVNDAQTRMERRLAAMRVIEAVRLHAAANKGAIPATLDAIKGVKVPLDPSTDKPFDYKVDASTFTLSSPGMGSAAVKLTYIVTVKP